MTTDMHLFWRRSLAVMIALVSLAGIVAGCGSSSSSTTSKSSGAAASGGSSSSSAASSQKPVTIGFAESFTSVPFYQVAGEGAKAAAADDGHAKAIVVGPAQSSGTAEANMALQLQQSQNPDGMALDPCALPAWKPVINQIAHNIPSGDLLTFNCEPTAGPGQSSPIKTVVANNLIQWGTAGAENAIKAGGLSSSTTGTALVAKCANGYNVLDGQDQGLVAGVKKALPKAKIVQFVSGLTAQQNLAGWTSKLSNTKNVVFATGVCDQDTGSLVVLKQHGTLGKAVIGAQEGVDPQTLKSIADGQLAATTTSNPWIKGYVATKLLIDAARGQKLPQGWINTGSYPITKANVAAWQQALTSPQAAEKFFLPMAQKILNGPAKSPAPIADSF